MSQKFIYKRDHVPKVWTSEKWIQIMETSNFIWSQSTAPIPLPELNCATTNKTNWGFMQLMFKIDVVYEQ